MKQMRKRILSVVLALLILAGCAVGGVTLWNNRSKKQIKVYSIGDFSMTDYWGDSNTTDGMVDVDGLQTIYLSDTQTVNEVLVAQGDTVKKGDPLLTYDTTLTEIDLQKKEVEVKQLELDLTQAQKELSTINTYKPGVYIPGSVTTIVIPGIPAPEEEPFVEDGTVPLLSGDGSYANPFVYQWKDEYTYNDAFLYQCMRGLDDAYVTFLAPGSMPEEQHSEDGTGWHYDGENHWKICADCGKEMDKAAHTLTWVIDKEATATENGLKHQECSVCGYKGEPVEIEKTDHTHSADSTGWHSDSGSHWQICSVCGEKINSAAHDYRWVTDKEAGETEPGARHQECSVCGAKGETEEIPATGHTHKPDGTWHSDADGHWQACTGCDEKLEAAPHSFDWVTDKEATETEAGQRHEECSVCGYQGKTEEIPATGGSAGEPEQTSSATTADTQLQASWTMQFQKTDAGYTCQLLSLQVGTMQREVGKRLPALPEKEPAEDIPGQTITDGIKYTKDEIASMKAEAEQKVKETDLNLRKAKLEYEKAEAELNNGAIYSELDGKVSSVITEDEARDSGEPMVKVTAGGGFCIQGTVSELLRDTVQPGQTVTLRSWESGTECQGTVESVSDYPADNSGWWNGNSNVSAYPFTVFVDESAGLRQGEYVEISYGDTQQSGSGFYLESMFIRSENGKSYVYTVNADGKLEKRFISTGKSVWGSYTEVKSGLTLEDYVAFPYGDGLRDGAETVVSTQQEFYGW